MHGKEGDLKKFNKLPGITLSNKLDVFIQVVKAVRDLYKHNLYYGDLKLENVLYEMKDGKPKIYLGDIGGIVHDFEEIDVEYFKIFKGYYLMKVSTFESNELYIVDNYPNTRGSAQIGYIKSDWDTNIKSSEILEHKGKILHKITDDINGTIEFKRDTGLFTYSLTPGGQVFMNGEKGILELINNIFHSIFVTIFALAFNKGYKFGYDRFNLKESIEEINDDIIMIYPELAKEFEIFVNHLVASDKQDITQDFINLNGDIVDMTRENVIQKFNDIIKATKLIKNEIIKIEKK